MTELALSALLALQPIRVDGTLCHPSRLIVKSEVANELRKEGFPVVAEFKPIGFASIQIPSGDLEGTYRSLRKTYGSERIFLDRAAEIAYTPTDPLYGNSWHHANIGSDLLWDTSFGSSAITVAVIDTGVFTGHPDLAPNLWTNTGEFAGNGVDDDSNGYVDDVNGYDFGYGDPIPNDVNGHGTACAGIVAAAMDNGIGGTGVAPLAKIMSLKASIDSGYFYDTANIGAYLYAAAMGADIISCSFFSDRVSPPERAALEYIVSQGVLPFVAAGNARTVIPYYPAAHEACVSVAALNTGSTKAGFSNWGSHVDIAAPGVSLVATTASGGYTTGFAGTSGACPVAAGAAALLWGANPTLTATQIRNLLEDTALPTIQSPLGEYTGYGRVQVFAASQSVPAAPARSVVVRAASPLYATGGRRTNGITRIYGRGFAGATNLSVKQGGVPVRYQVMGRDHLQVATRPIAGPLEIMVGTTTVASIALPSQGIEFPLIEASSPTNGLTGGFSQARASDGQVLTVPRDGNGLIQMEGTFRDILPNRPLTLSVDRSYVGGSAGTETIKVYNWSTDSYPYGQFTTLSTMPVASANGTVSFTLPNPGGLADVDRVIYLVIETSGTDAGTTLQVDRAVLKS